MKTIPALLLAAWAALWLTGPAPAPGADAPPTAVDQAFEDLKTYDDGQSTAALLALERYVGQASKDAAARRQVAARLEDLLAEPKTTYAARKFICQQLRLVGGDEQVPRLERMLREPETAELARLTLEALPGKAAAKALLAALPEVTGNTRLGVLYSLGVRRETAAIPALARHLADSDYRLAATAAGALGLMGTREAAEALAAAPASPAVLDAQLVCAAGLVRQGQAALAAPLYEKVLAGAPPLNLRAAALAGFAQAAPAKAWPVVQQALLAEEPAWRNQAIELARAYEAPEAVAALAKALPALEGASRMLALGALAERGDREAMAALQKLAAGTDPMEKTAASRELRRIRYAAKDAAVRAQADAGVPEVGSSVAALSPAPYPPAAADQRRLQVADGLRAGDRLLAYLDCGAEVAAQSGGISLRQVNGGVWLYPGSEKVAAAPFGTVAFDGNKVEFEIAGLDAAKQYALGFSWWDYDNNGRSQAIEISGGEPSRRAEVLRAIRLPAFEKARQGPALGHVPIAAAFSAKGKLRISFVRRAASNATVSELWLMEVAGRQDATNAAVGSAPPAAAPPAPKPAVDLTPFPDGIRVLLVTGIDYPGHKWRETAPVIRGLLEKDPRLRVRIVEDPEALAAAKLADWEVVLLHFQNWETNGPGAKARENLRQYVANGGGLISVHFACGAWHGEWPEFQDILGRVWHGSGPGKSQHDPYGAFSVQIVDRQHPITAGLADFDTTDELYTCLTGDAPIHLLAQAKSKVDQKEYPQAFTRDYAKGRVFLTTLGHDVRAYTQAPAVGELLRRACAWAARKEVQP